jgi:hypothetical protein
MSFDFTPLDLTRLHTYPLKERENRVTCSSFAAPPPPGALSVASLLDMIPPVLAGQEYRQVVEALVGAYRKKLPVVITMGAHLIKVGLSPILIHLMERGIISAVAMNGAGSIHDTEISVIGGTSEDVSHGLKEGNFGMVFETGHIINDAARRACQEKRGFGDTLGEMLAGTPHEAQSILARGKKLGIPVTIHIALGSDIIHTHPEASGEYLGSASFYDFRLFCGVMAQVGEGSVIMNIGSAVVMPTVIEKGIAVARNLGYPVRGFTGVTLDFNRHYRSNLNPVQRARDLEGNGIYLVGHHELTVPLIAAGVLDALSRE